MKIKLLLFDAGDVLFQSNTAVSEAISKKFNIPSEDLAGLWKNEYQKLSRGLLTTEEFLDVLADKYGIQREQLRLKDLTAPYMENLAFNPGIEDLIKELSKRKIKLALLSDTSEMFHAARNELDIFKYFDKQFVSFEIGHMKPDKRTFQRAIDYYRMKPDEIFFIDDNPINISTAKSLGMEGVVFANTKQLTQVLKNYRIM